MRRPVPPPSPFRFRPMRPADLDRIVEIEKEGFLHPWSRDLLEREMSHAWSHVLVALEAFEEAGQGDPIIGYVVFWLVHDEVHVLNLGTALAARRRGVGRALMEEAHATGRKRGAALSTLEVRRSNLAALALYRDLGYRQVGVRPNYYAEEGEDAIVMVRDLTIG
ncbi:MAG: ribosomal protein S18-alanine N-acetyltransferase [Anaeromyxobacteraceae bacterium]